ncbi:protein of unknown function [Paenibacillus sp. RU4T]|nr:protein of unknown function [Paenibacillus sp. RU4X]SIR61564.1 protein of unknown function [Paenibacillus sp. RU4T]
MAHEPGRNAKESDCSDGSRGSHSDSLKEREGLKGDAGLIEDSLENGLSRPGEFTVPIPGSPEDDRLRAAIRDGLDRGKSRSVPRRRKRWSLGAASLLLALVLVTAGAAKVSPAIARALQQIPSLSGFLKLIGEDSALRSAIDMDLLQPVGKTVENKGIRLTVDALIADDRRLVIFYTTNMTAGWEKSVKIKILDENGTELKGSIRTNHSAMGKTAYQPRGPQDYVDVLLQQGETMPDRVTLKAELDGTMLETDLDIDTGRSEGMAKTYELNKTLSIEGQKLTIVRARQTPLQMEITLRKDSANTKEIKGFLNLRLIDGTGKQWIDNTGFLGNEIMSLAFQNSYFDSPGKLTLLADGFYMFDKGQKVVVDTEKKQVLQAPDSRLKIGGSSSIQDNRSDYQVMALELTALDPNDRHYIGYNMLSNTFTDGQGAVHKIAYPDRFQASESETSKDAVTLFYPLPNGSFPQPLTFDVEDYPGYAKMPVEVELMPKQK